MTDVTIGSLVNFGAAGAVIAVVGMFLKAGRSSQKDFRDWATLHQKSSQDAAERMADACRASQERSSEALREAAQAIGALLELNRQAEG